MQGVAFIFCFINSRPNIINKVINVSLIIYQDLLLLNLMSDRI